MACARCHAEVTAGSRKWCADCERNYDQWVRRHASDIVWQALSGTVVIMVAGVGLPLLGVGSLVAAVGAFAGFGTILGLSRLTRRVRRRQFLQAPLPRAYLPAPK
ncbi:MAG: hypothetical protein JWO36_4174 [Myxococcales bacterium]|nr:hypothetical protein [Myxococcales bacterium]